MKKVVLIGGGVGSSTFTKALKNFPIELSTLVNTFDDGGSTGAIRRDYGGIALGDLRQCFLASIDLNDEYLKALNYRFGRGNLYGVNVGNLLFRAFLNVSSDQKSGIYKLHKLFNLKNKIIPISYVFAQLCAITITGSKLLNEREIAEYFSFSKAPIKSLLLSKKVKINPDAYNAIKNSDFIIFAPGNFFTSLLPHIYVDGFSEAWRKSRAKKVWMVNLLAHKGQDSFYTLRNYFAWFQKKLGKNPFHYAIINKKISNNIVDKLKDRYEPLRIINGDKKILKSHNAEILEADLVSSVIRGQQTNDTITRAPLRHDVAKIQKFFKKFLDV